jgi:molecular chaperone HtpG
VVDSEDLPLNISREMLQNNPQVEQIRKGLTGRVLTELENLADKDAEAFAKTWATFGKIVKEGLYEDFERRDQLLALCRFNTTAGDTRSLKQYIADFKPNQTEIYYLVGESAERVKSNPKLEAARARGVEVLLLTDPVDAFWTSAPLGFEGKPFRSLSQGDVDFELIPRTDQGADAEPKPDEGEETTIVAAVKAALGERVSDVRASKRLTDSAACLVADSRGRDRELERLLARQSRGSGTKPILELNVRHPILKMLSRAKADGRDDEVADLSALLFEQAQILDGEVPNDPAQFAARINRLVARGLA